MHSNLRFPPCRWLLPVALATLIAAPWTTALSAQAGAAEVDFARQIRPLFARSCLACHGPEKQQGGLRLDVREQVLAGGDSGEPALVRGKPDASPLVARIASRDESLQMPPEGERLSAADLALVRRWIEEGAVWPDAANVAPDKPGRKELQVVEADRKHWAYAPLSPVEAPAVRQGGWVRTPVDAFVLARLESEGLAPAAEADRARLIRRLYFDLVGLPPSPEELAAALADDRPTAWTELVDRLLASPDYGERWARHWLDLARYADSDGYERDADRPHAWPYRDFVIRAFHDDLPYDTFLRWQLAGDELAPDNAQAVAATGFLAAGPVVFSDTKLEEERRRYRYDELDDVLGTASAAMLGLTLSCARCHDHKYDALPTRDYYRALSAFVSTERKTLELAVEAPGGSAKISTLAVVDRARREPAWLLPRGDVMNRQEEVSLGFLTVLSRGKSPDDYRAMARERVAPQVAQRSSLDRAALALWLTDAEQGAGALAARVMVNRLWQHHFGEGLVRTASDFGVRGEPPSHPELLEWLARRLAADGWRLKSIQRAIVNSATYRQSAANARAAAHDPDNRLLARRRPQRLESEALRDAMLAAAGVLNRQRFGPGVKPPVPPETMAAYNTLNPYPRDAKDDDSTRRRSIYLFAKRSLRHPLLEVFDGADSSVSCARRVPTTVAPQALAQLNDPLVRRWADEFAGRVLRDRPDSIAEPIDRAWQLALARAPRADEASAARDFLARRTDARRARGKSPDEAARQAWTDLCQALFALNEFLYVD